MTGAEFRTMKFTKAVLAALMMVVAGSGQADTSATATLIINVTFTQPSCEITVPPSYNLGTLTPGSKPHTPLNITWKCEGDTPVKTALTAVIVRGGTASRDDQVVLLTDSGTPTGATLSLRENKSTSLIKLTGPGAGDYFCSDDSVTPGTTMRTCTLTPETNVSQNGPFGLASATLRFEVGYP
ncbi:F18 fimbrial protein FedE [Escherichia coli]|uniref:F18 fimbrial protein FedE n=1 Tax=Escherichia coli TaxID=562 RepID=A0A6N8R0N0_ECOLX|nr:F18 fimbrial protein FedE [Escherichia coli]EFM6592530.1 F18 fimbrial protein FedE [Escherichia coli]MBB7021379.1 F18 fimbrial protein FedE [Escherichia coli]MBB9739070.1 F18 fimbrial protein FedE [Escherichia coli]MXI21731.1 F18 fimbrial protein FedE [Escherichia coli]